MFSPLPRTHSLLLPLLLAFAGPALAQNAMVTSGPVVVTATRLEQNSFELPVSIDSVGREQIQDGQLGVNLSESLVRIPGIVAQNRQNYAQDLQISSRGFGARASFGVRGMRIYSDGIPATMPDGQGQVSHIDLGSAARIEVMRGPFSSLYGNSSGGVISVFSEEGQPGARIEPSLAFGSYDTRRLAVKVSGDTGKLNYLASLSSFRTDGYRDHSAAKRETGNARLRWSPDGDTRIGLVANAVDMPDIQDPLGLDRASYDANQRQAVASAYQFDTRKSASQQQVGLNFERKLGPRDTATAMVYRGHRDTVQYQAITTAAQTAATHPGGVIDLARDYWGIDARWTHLGELAGGVLTVTGGVNYDNLDEVRKGYQNFIGTQTGILGALRRDENNRIHNFDQYVQVQWEPSAAWLLIAGIRHSDVKVVSADKYVVGTNRDDSGSVSYGATTPVLGVTWRAAPALNVYASAGRGFETPTMNELSYRASGSGLNFALQPARSDNLEFGAKTLLDENVQVNAAIFSVKTRDELVTLQNTGGRAVFQNVGGTRRSGLELAATADLAHDLRFNLMYSSIMAIYSEAFLSCTGTPCAAPNTAVAAGNLIPGVPRSVLAGELSWRHAPIGFLSALELRRTSSVFVNDANSDAAEAYTLVNLKLGFTQTSAGFSLKEFLRVDNIGNRKYSGSVIVNEGNSRFFEPGPGRNYLVGVTASYGF